MIYDIRETEVGVYRQHNVSGLVVGYTLCPPGPGAEKVGAIDPERDSVPQIQVHVFGTRDEARAFREGLILAGEPEHDCERIPEGWAVLRLVPYGPDDDGDPSVKVITYNAPPRVLVTVTGGAVSTISDSEDLDIRVLDYDANPQSSLPRRFKTLVSRGRYPITLRRSAPASDHYRVAEGLPEAYSWLERRPPEALSCGA